MAVQDLDAELHKLRINKSSKRAPRRGFGGVVLLLLIASAAGGTGLVYYTKATAAVQVKIVRPQVIEARAAGVPAGTAVLTAGGYIIPRERIEISSKIIGLVKEIYVKPTDVVKVGDPILKIEDEEYQDQVRLSEARLQTARTRLKELKTGSRPQEIDASKAAVASSEAHLHWTEQELKRLERLLNEKVISARELDQAKREYDVAVEALKAAKKRDEMTRIGPRQEEIDFAASQVREAEASLEYAKTQLGFTTIRSPIAGTILEKIADRGELVTNSNFGGTRGPQSSVVQVADLKDLQAELDINETDIPKVRMDQKTEIRLDSNPDRVLRGQVDEIAPQADRQKATVKVKVKIFDPDQSVRPEMSARVTFLEEEKQAEKPAEGGSTEPRIRIPKAALAGGTTIFIASDGRAVLRKVKPGREREGTVEIEDGLVGTEQIIIEPLDRMKDGVRVQVVP